jgi:hypothetical protein
MIMKMTMMRRGKRRRRKYNMRMTTMIKMRCSYYSR